jgi:hypothetical protein
LATKKYFQKNGKTQIADFLQGNRQFCKTAENGSISPESIIITLAPGLADALPRQIPRLLINRDRVGSFGSRPHDSILLGDLADSLEKLAEALGWAQDLKDLCPTKPWVNRTLFRSGNHGFTIIQSVSKSFSQYIYFTDAFVVVLFVN